MSRVFRLLLLFCLSIPALAAASEDYMSQYTNRMVLEGHKGEVYKVGFVPNSKHLLISAGYRDSTLRLWDTRTGKQLDIVDYNSASSRPRDFAFSPDGKRVSVILSYGAIRTYPITDNRFGEREVYWGKSVGKHGQLAMSRKGTFFAITSRNKPVTVANVKKYREYQPYLGTEDFRTVDFSANDSIFAAADGGNQLAFWDILALQGFGAKQAYDIKGIEPGTGTWALAFSRDGRQLATGHIDGHVTLWQVNGITAKQNRRFKLPQSAFTPAFSPRGEILAASCQTGSVYLWDTQSGKQIKSYPGSVGSLLTLDINTNGSKMAAGSLKGPIVIWH